MTRVGWGTRDDKVTLAQLGEGRRDVEHVFGLEPKVELLDDGLGEELDQRRWVGQRGDRNAADQVGGQPRHDGEVLMDPAGHRGPLDLYHHFGSVEQLCPVDLGDRRRRQGVMVDGGEHLTGGAAELLGDHLFNDGPGFGRHLIAAPFEFRHELGREDPIARRHNLSELDVGRPQALCRDPEAPGDPGGLLRTASPPFGEVPKPQGTTEVAHGGPHSGPRGQSPATDEIGERGPQLGADAVQAGFPSHLVRE